MNKNTYRGHRFPPAIIQVTVWMYARFTLSLRDVEELLAERGLDISYETVRRWFLKFGQVYARSIRHGRHRLSTPERFCSGFPEQKCSTDASKKASDIGGLFA